MAHLLTRIVPMIAAGAMLGLGATAAEAQSRYGGQYRAPYQAAYQTPYAEGRYGYETDYRYERTYRSERRSSGYSDWSVAAQRDRPGDYRCDAFWDANRTDCDARWRDQRHRTSYGSGSYGYDRGYRDHDRRYDRDGYGYGGPQPYYGSRYRHPSAYGQGGATPYYGTYGRPDLVYPGSGSAYGGGRDARRVDWCRRTYRSYDPRTGYYRAYSGRLIYCG